MQFHILSFEGPDAYARAGGIATRVEGLTFALSQRGFETHLWFVGDPRLPGYEQRGCLHLHRWCQWISSHHGGGVYDGEEGKQADFASSLPPHLYEHVLAPHLANHEPAIVLAEEWQTVDAVLHLDWLLRRAGLRQRAHILWNANNVFGFDRIDWGRLSRAAVVTTVSRYMKHHMRGLGVDPLVIPNGLASDAFLPPERAGMLELRRRLRDRTVVTKVARFDPDKRWLLAVEIVARLKAQGARPLLIARGGAEAHGHEVFAAARQAGLRVAEHYGERSDVQTLLDSVESARNADILSLRFPLGPESRRVLYRSADAVLANSSHEPFGLVGLEAMAAGGVACTGCSGEDYAVSGRNALVLQTNDPQEFLGLFHRLRTRPEVESAIRRTARRTARHYAWSEIMERVLLPRLDLLASSA